jgi:hypothetical protein
MLWIIDVLHVVEPCLVQSCTVNDPSFAGVSCMSKNCMTSIVPLFSLMRACPEIRSHLLVGVEVSTRLFIQFQESAFVAEIQVIRNQNLSGKRIQI